ncbi:hypothetical protein [uncultured Nisaea sp.]|uniref:hypothetical protein n=1 Tax=uncultured Nisaea sp. TaxID=538215 RepID=UPI0030EE69A5
MGLFDFLKVRTKGPARPTKAQGIKSVKAKGKLEACGIVKIDSFTFVVKDYNLKGFIIEPYDKDVLIKSQRFRFEIDVSKGNHKMKGQAEAVVTKITDNALAAAFTIKPYDH